MVCSPQAKPVILVVDDEAIVRINATDMLEDAGFATLEAASAEDALSLLASHPEVTVLFTDINMPGRFDGLELARRVQGCHPLIRLIITSGLPQTGLNDFPAASAFVPKPYDADSIVDAVRAFPN